MSSEQFSFEAIGSVRNTYQKKYDAPRQPLQDGANDESYSTIHLLPHRNYEQALEDVRGFDRIWLLYVFHKNAHWKPKVLPPRGRQKRGVFATRAPYRPNPIGISVVTLLDVQGLVLHVGNCDVLDGTPVLDIKPYIPLYDSFPESRTGWLEEELATTEVYTIELTEQAKRHLDFLNEHLPEAWLHWQRVLSSDPLPHPYRRIVRRFDQHEEQYECSYKDWRLVYRVDELAHSVVIELLQSRYNSDIIESWRRLLSQMEYAAVVSEIPANATLHVEFYQKYSWG
jgi:tRNA (adenine37-N6)-methyltransferase